MKKDLDWKVDSSKKIIKASLKKWKGNIGIAFTGRKDSTVMLHLTKSVTRNLPPIMFIDHGEHFHKSIKHFNKMRKLWKLEVKGEIDKSLMKEKNLEKNLQKKQDIIQRIKIKAIADTITKNNWKALMVAIRKDENPARSNEKFFSKRESHTRVHPLLHWTEDDIWEYIKKNKVPYNPLYDQGYRSIGEKEFTRKSKKDDGERSGRNQDKEKVMKRLRALGYF